jgi:Protein of unknown function (DUF4242)
MLYVAKCYWPDVTEREVQRVGVDAAREAATVLQAGDTVRYIGAIVFPQDDLVLCIFEGPSRRIVMRTTERAGIPCERLMESIWLGPPTA